jgi:hypothetical protein
LFVLFLLVRATLVAGVFAVAHTLRDIDVTARKAIEGGEPSVHVDTMLIGDVN